MLLESIKHHPETKNQRLIAKRFRRLKQKSRASVMPNDEGSEDARKPYCDRMPTNVYDPKKVFAEGNIGPAKEQSEAIETIHIGAAEYRLRRPSFANATPTEDRTWEFHVEAFEPQFVGRGNSIAEAKSDFYLLIHSTFQSLVRVRPFRMTEEQISKWNVLETAIDVEEYWRTVPVTLRELGIVSSSQRGSRQVLWLDGKLTEEINVDQVPAEFFSFAENQWFEAIVEREPGSHKLRRLIYVQQVDPVRQLTEDERRKWFDSLPGSDSLPKSDLTWKTL